MRIKYMAAKGHRIKKGSLKINNHRRNIFLGLTILENINNCWWCEELNKWGTFNECQGHDFEDTNNNIKNLKQAIRHIKKHSELKKGTKLVLSSNFVGYDIDITI